MNNSVNYENQIIGAIQTVVTDAVENAGYDKTIKARIIEQTNKTTGEYKVRYQDSTFLAYSADVDIKYVKDSLVYILIPNNDMSQIKTIVSAVDKDNVEYVQVLETEDYYDIIGGNACNDNTERGLCSYNGSTTLVLYDTDTSNPVNLINYDEQTFKLALYNQSNIMLGASFKTALDAAQRRKGDYGIEFEIEVKDDVNPENTNIRTLVLDTNSMKGDPYNLKTYIRQVKVFDLDNEKYIRIKKITFYCKGFPNTEGGHSNDIFITNPIIYAVEEIPEEERNGYTVKIIPEKAYFTEEDISTTENILNSIVKIRGTEPSSERNLEYYWFKENLDIYPSTDGYNNYGGAGWECLNDYNVLSGTSENPTSVEYITDKSTLTIKKSDCVAYDNKYKLVVVFNEETSVSAEISIINYDAAFDFIISSDEGIDFYYGNGTPTLTAGVVKRGDTPIPATLSYQWTKIDKNGLFTVLENTTIDNNIYNTALTEYNARLVDIENGVAMPSASASYLAERKTIIDSYDYKQRVEDNKIYKIQINKEIDEYCDYKCSFYSTVNGVTSLIGIAVIRLNNYPEIEGECFLNIINGEKTFNYNAAGLAPTNENLENPIKLQPLTFTIVDSRGEELPERVLNSCGIQWTIPTENSLLSFASQVDLTQRTLSYTLAEPYDITKLANNTIKLDIRYQNIKLHAETNFTFVKDGDPGVNGTDIICKIVPYTDDPTFNEYPILYYDSSSHWRLNYTPHLSGAWFEVQLWRNNELKWHGMNSSRTANVKVRWINLLNYYGKNQNNNDVYDKSHIKILESSTAGSEYYNYSFSFNNIDSSLATNQVAADIIQAQVEYEGHVYYCTLPVITIKVADATSTDLNIKLEKNTGFRNVIYTSDGLFPQYENNLPFTLKVNQLINSFIEDITNTPNSTYQLTYNWSAVGAKYYRSELLSEINPSWHTDLHLDPGTIFNNTAYFTPSQEFDGRNLTNAVKIVITQGSSHTQIAEMHIPIHFYLNRYGNAALNGWDGNSIEINDEGGTILSPQVGAGKKEDDNSFTGIIMGGYLEAGKEGPEHGLYGFNQGEKTIELNAKDGSAKFGKAGAGQIVISPDETDTHSVLRSGHYVAPVLDPQGNIITPGQGLEIDLTDPHITFGSGKFRVTNAGDVYASGYSTIADLNAGNIDIPGVENFKPEYTTDTVQFETNSGHVPSSTVTKTITCTCLYKDIATTGYTVDLVDAQGNVITHDTVSDGIELNITKPASSLTTTISFAVATSRIITNTINSYSIRFTHTASGLTSTKKFYANLVVIGADGQNGERGPAGPAGADGTSVTIKGTYNSLAELTNAHPSGNTLGDGYIIGLDLYVYTNGAGGSGSLSGDWTDVGQIKGEDAKRCFIVGDPEVFNSTDGGLTYYPTSSTIKAYLQAVTFNAWAYWNGTSYVDIPNGTPGITINGTTITLYNNCSLFGNDNTILLKATTSDNDIYDIITITKIKDGVDGQNGQDGVSPYIAYLTNDSQVFTSELSTAVEITTQLYAYQGDTEKTVTITKVNNVNASTSYTATGITGLQFKIDNVSAINHPTISFKASNMNQSEMGQIPIKYKIGTGAEKTIYFSYSTTTTGPTGPAGENAKDVNIVPSNSVFKSTDGGNTFAPNNIVLSLQLQNLTYTQWYYIDTSGQEQAITNQSGLSIDGTTHALTISKDSEVFDNTSSVVFKVKTNNNDYYDTKTITKWYDTGEIVVGGRNYLLNTTGLEAKITNGGSDSKALVFSPDFTPENFAGKTMTLSWYYEAEDIAQAQGQAEARYGHELAFYSDSTHYTYAATLWRKVADGNGSGRAINTFVVPNNWNGVLGQEALYIQRFATGSKIRIYNPKLEIGNVATDWTVAPEDVETSISDAVAGISYVEGALYCFTNEITPKPALPGQAGAPEWNSTAVTSETKYLWQTVGTRTGSTITYSSPVCLTTPRIQTLYEEYCASTNSSTPPGSGWSQTIPAYDETKNLWVRTITIYAGSTTKYDSNYHIDTTWQASSQLEANLRKYAKTLDDLNDGAGTIKVNDACIEAVSDNQLNKLTITEKGIGFGYKNATYTCNGNEDNNSYHFTYGDKTYHFIMPTVANNDKIIFNGTKLYLNTIDNNIPIDLSDAGTALTFTLSSNWDTVTSVWSLDGTFNAQNISVLNLTAESIVNGDLSIGKNFNQTQNNGMLKIYDTQDHLIIQGSGTDGLTVSASDASQSTAVHTKISPSSGLSGYDTAGNKIYEHQNDKFYIKREQVDESITIGQVKIISVSGTRNGISFVPNIQ